MAETIKIGGELESTATGNVVAAASAIKDKTKNKYQSEINDDVARHETEIHGTGGIDSRVTDLEAMEQIVIDGGEAQIAQGSDFTNPDATKRAKIPTVGAIVDGLNDGIYDVSKRNPTGGPNSDGKFTLEYILSNANTLIPTGWRHGGMSISFVDSSDNKYVQYRLMSDTFNTTVANWQGVDDVPIDGSHNLVESGGVYDSILDIKGCNLISPSSYTTEYYLYSDGRKGGTYPTVRTYIIPAGNFKYIECRTSHDDRDQPAIGFYSSTELNSSTYMKNESIQANTGVNYYYAEIPEGCVTVVIGGAERASFTPFVRIFGDGGFFNTINAINNSLVPINGKVSIIGDSISTFEGTLPNDYETYFPQGDVISLYDMWWHLLLSLTDSSLDVNASYSGSRVTNTDVNRPDFYSRTSILGTPDCIFVALGTNDWVNSVTIGDYDYSSSISELSESEFIPAYTKGVKSLLTNYPNAKIILLVFQMNDDYAQAIENIGSHFNLQVIDVRAYYNTNDPHPDKKGMSLVSHDIMSFYIKGKIDDEPIAESKNLVKSGGVSKSISDIKGYRFVDTSKHTTDYYRYDNGNKGGSDEDVRTYIIPSNNFEYIECTTNHNDTNQPAIAFYSSIVPNSLSYMKNDSIQGKTGVNSYFSKIPDGCITIVIGGAVRQSFTPDIKIFKKGEFASRVSVEGDVASLLDCSVIKNRFVKYSDGELGELSVNDCDLYLIPNDNFRSVKVKVGSSDGIPYAIGFYSTNEISGEGYIKDHSVQITPGVFDYVADVPNNTSLIVVFNNRTYCQKPEAKFIKSYGINELSGIKYFNPNSGENKTLQDELDSTLSHKQTYNFKFNKENNIAYRKEVSPNGTFEYNDFARSILLGHIKKGSVIYAYNLAVNSSNYAIAAYSSEDYSSLTLIGGVKGKSMSELSNFQYRVPQDCYVIVSCTYYQSSSVFESAHVDVYLNIQQQLGLLEEKVFALPIYTTSQVLPLGDRLDTSNPITVLEKGTNIETDDDYESIDAISVFWDSIQGKYGLVYAGYNLTKNRGAVVCIAWSHDLVHWEKDGVILRPNDTSGTPDYGSCSGPRIFIHNGEYYLYYNAASQAGYENGKISICLATGTDIHNLERYEHNPIVDQNGYGSWCPSAVYKPDIVKWTDGVYYAFYNGRNSKSPWRENIGVMRSHNLIDWDQLGTLFDWGPEDDRLYVYGDPNIYDIGDEYIYMAYAFADGSWDIKDCIARCLKKDFPYNWQVRYKYDVTNTAVNRYCGKPAIIYKDNKQYHFCCNNTSSIKLFIQES